MTDSVSDIISRQAVSCQAEAGREGTGDRNRVGEGVQRGPPPPSQGEATMLPCSTSPAVAPVAAATAAAAAVTEAGEVVCLLPTVKSPVPNQTRRKSRFTRGGGGGWRGGGKDG